MKPTSPELIKAAETKLPDRLNSTASMMIETATLLAKTILPEANIEDCGSLLKLKNPNETESTDLNEMENDPDPAKTVESAEEETEKTKAAEAMKATEATNAIENAKEAKATNAKKTTKAESKYANRSPNSAKSMNASKEAEEVAATNAAKETGETNTVTKITQSAEAVDATKSANAERAEDACDKEIACKAEDACTAKDARKTENIFKIEDARQAEEACTAENARQAEEACTSEDACQAKDACKTENARQAEDACKTENARQAEDACKTEIARQAENARKAENATNENKQPTFESESKLEKMVSPETSSLQTPTNLTDQTKTSTFADQKAELTDCQPQHLFCPELLQLLNLIPSEGEDDSEFSESEETDLLKLESDSLLNFSSKKLDDKTRESIRSYTSKEYNEVLNMLDERFTSPAYVMQHIEEHVNSLPRATEGQPIEKTQEALDRLRSVVALMTIHQLERSFELEVFRAFSSKIPKTMSDKYVKTLRGQLPSLKNYLMKMEPLVKQRRAESIYYPDLAMTSRRRVRFEEADDEQSSDDEQNDREHEQHYEPSRRSTDRREISRRTGERMYSERPEHFESRRGKADHYPNDRGMTDYRPRSRRMTDYCPSDRERIDYRPSIREMPDYRPRNRGAPDYQRNVRTIEAEEDFEENLKGNFEGDRSFSQNDFPVLSVEPRTMCLVFCPLLTPFQRRNVANNNRLCYLCLGEGHLSY
ncbi:hypothetical protein TYRP_016758, partial [Tyrophagus putrescentiae]